jgi:hypothetical protein
MKKIGLIFVMLLLVTGCSAVKFGAGMIAESLVHQGGHYVGAKVSGVDIEWVDGLKSIPGFQPNEHMTHSKPEPLAYGGSLLFVGLTSELIMWKTDVLKDEKGEKFLTDFWMGYLVSSSFDELNYGLRRSGLFGGDGENDLSKDNFGKYHKLAGAVSAIHGGRIAYKLAKGKRTNTYWNRAKMWVSSLKNSVHIGISYIF